MKLPSRFIAVLFGLLLSFSASASPLGGTYTLFSGEESALKAVAGSSKHVLILFGDYSN